MNRGKIVFGIFAVVALAQLAAPASRIYTYERTLREGRVYKFQAAPLDPYDPFRGRYVTLQLEQVTAPWAGTDTPRRGQKVYASITVKDDGFAQFSGASPDRPTSGDYLRVPIAWVEYAAKNTVRLDLPFDRYYMEESAAPAAEKAVQEHLGFRGSRPGEVYVTLRVRNGVGVIEDLIIAGKPIRQFLRDEAEKKRDQ
jgi:uncharacterized membrane-anchored protein